MKALTQTLRIAMIALTMMAGGIPAFAAPASPVWDIQTDEVARACYDRYGRIVPCPRRPLV